MSILVLHSPCRGRERDTGVCLKRQSQLQQTTNFATSFPIFEKKGIMFHENRLPADDSHENIIPFLLFLKKRQKSKLLSAANYRWRSMG